MKTVNLMTAFSLWFESQPSRPYKTWCRINLENNKLPEINDKYAQSFNHDLFNLDLDNLQNEMAKIKSNLTLPNRKNTAFENYNKKTSKGIPLAIINTHYMQFLQPYVSNDLLAEDAENDYTGIEGDRVKKRNSKLRTVAIKIHGAKCLVCGFNVEDVYGERGKGYTDIHHIVPLSEANERAVNPVADLVPVCANCHRMIHRHKENVLSVDDMKKILNKKQQIGSVLTKTSQKRV